MSEPQQPTPPETFSLGSLGSGVAAFRRVAVQLGFGVIAVGLLAFLIVIYLPVLKPMLWAAVMAALFFPVHQRIFRWVGQRERTAASISTALTVLIVVGPASLLTFNFISQAQNLWPSIRDFLGGDTFQRIATWLESSPLRPIATYLLPDTELTGAAGIEESLRQAVSTFGNFALQEIQEIGRTATGRLLGAAVTMLIYFFFLRHGPRWLEHFENALPLESGQAANLFSIAGRTINAVFRGVIITAAVQAVLAGIGFAIAGAPAPMVLAAVTFLAALIPFVGPIAIWLPIGIGLFATGHTTAGVGLMVWGLLVVSLVDNFLRPFLIGREAKLPLLWLFLSILGGIRVYGLLGILLGPAALALFLACYRIYMEGRRT